MGSSYGVVERHDLTEAEWRRIAPVLPPPARRGRRPGDRRPVLNGILWILATGASWRDLPARYPPWPTCYAYFRRWERDGTSDRLHRALQRTLRADYNAIDLACSASTRPSSGRTRRLRARDKNTPPGEPADHALGRSRGGFSTKLSLVTDGQGLGLAARVQAGPGGDLDAVTPLLEQIAIPGRAGAPLSRCPRRRQGALLRPVRRWCRRHRVTAVLPRRADQRPIRGRRFDRIRYRQRQVIEVAVGHLKEFRRIDQWADKLAVRYCAWVILGMVRLILRRHLLNTA